MTSAFEGLAVGAFVLRHVVAGALIAGAAFVVGRSLSRPDADGDGGDGLETAAVATTLGLAALSQVCLLLGLCGVLRPWPAAIVVAAMLAASGRGWRALAAGVRRGLAGRAGLAGLIMGLAGLAGIAPVAWLALYPPTAFDATLYHLPYARAFAASGGMPFLAVLRYPIFPQLQEALFAAVLLFADDVTTHLLALLATLLTAALLAAWGRRRFSPGAGWIAAAVYAGSPIVVYLAATAYIEPALVLYATAALYCVDRWQAGGAGEGGCRWLVLAVLFAGSAADCKYLGLFFLAVVGIAAVATGATIRRLGRLGRGAWVGVLGLLVIAPTYGRITAATGNPIFPYLPEVFGASPWVAREFHPLGGLGARWGEVVGTLARAPWDVILARGRLGGYPPYSPLVLLALPAVLALAWRDGRIRWMLGVAGAYGFAVCALLPDARYLLAALPLVCLGIGEALARVGEAVRSRVRSDGRSFAAVAAAMAVACFLPGWAYAGYRIHLQGGLPVTAAERDAYLGRALPAYAAVRYLDGLRGSSYTLYAVHAENLAYFAAGRFLGDWSGPAGYRRIVPADGDAAVFYRGLRALGVDHLLLVEHDATLAALSASPAFGRLFVPLYSDGRARIYRLRDAGAAAVSPLGGR